MPMLAHFEERTGEDRRRTSRRALKLGIGGGAGPVTVHDLSATGVLLETSVSMLVGADFELELPHAGIVEAVVVWNSGEYYGCQFTQPISPAALSAALLQSAPKSEEESVREGVDPIEELRQLNDDMERLALKMDSALKRLVKE